MGIFITILSLIALAALGIVIYFKWTPEGRLKDVGSDLEEAHLQNKLLDSVESTREIQNELHARLESLRKE